MPAQQRKIKMGMIGGGRGAFIGTAHKIAAQMDGKTELVCGALSSDPERAKASGRDWFLAPERTYGSYPEMLASESKLPVGERMDFVTIVTPNHVHHAAAMAALDAGFHVVCDKPMTMNLAEARDLEGKVKSAGRLFCLTHTYTGYPMVKAAREIVRSGKLGQIRRIMVEYPQGWMASNIEQSGQKQAGWRTDPKQAGASCCMGDIGSHCENLAEYVTGQKITELCAELTTFVKGRLLEDDGSVLLRFDNGARGVLWASQIAIGRENDLSIRVFGEKGSIEWHQLEPNSLIVDWLDKPREILRTSTGFVGKYAAGNTRLPAGHPEGFLEAFANIYNNFAMALEQVLEGKKIREPDFDYPNVHDGVRGMAFLEAVVKSAKAKSTWVGIK